VLLVSEWVQVVEEADSGVEPIEKKYKEQDVSETGHTRHQKERGGVGKTGVGAGRKNPIHIKKNQKGVGRRSKSGYKLCAKKAREGEKE